jgi:hypothetical protein
LAVDYQTAVVDTQIYPNSQLYSNAIPGQILYYIPAEYNQAMAYQFTFSDSGPGFSGEGSPSGAGATWIGFGLTMEQLGLRYPFIGLTNIA